MTADQENEEQKARHRQRSGKELSTLAQKMVDANDPAEIERLKAAITIGFYGE